MTSRRAQDLLVSARAGDDGASSLAHTHRTRSKHAAAAVQESHEGRTVVFKLNSRAQVCARVSLVLSDIFLALVFAA